MYVQVACAVRVTQTPQTLDELGEGLLLWDHLNTELPSIEAKITPLFDQFAILDKYEVTVAEDVRTTLTDLPNKYRDFQQTLVDADIMLKKHKVRCAACFLSYNVAASIWSLHYLFLHRIVKWFDENPTDRLRKFYWHMWSLGCSCFCINICAGVVFEIIFVAELVHCS